MIQRQWPGSYAEVRFHGTGALFRVGAGEVALRVSVDGCDVADLVKPAPGLYRGDHLRVDDATHRAFLAWLGRHRETIRVATLRDALRAKRR